ncbi:hypothetical protein K435DRAFT_972090 [Dendrothele bispora CBS 962.96]|uniref:Zn(2)-C6 fungal-type domain-containing protein n=1 Tax=Dendrothele bispora (strain CBS 962.96) TaxID=1314807 RepID=A0A4V4HC62_DENBC|nr:hypothetical protein K435DRAFT_972090 [Dendrothele bispora CBS 962.96]
MSLDQSSSDALPPLHKGKACSNCRRRKVRCDAVKPVCGPCLRSTGAFSDCEYTESGFTQTQQLQDQIAVLEARIEELQTSGQGSVTLRNPYRGQELEGSSIRQPQPETPSQNASFGPGIMHLVADRLLEELPSNLHQSLINNFLPHAEEMGLFLDADRFAQVALDDQGPYEKPIPALLNAVYVIGAHFSTPAYPADTLAAFVKRALQTVSTGLQVNHTQKVIQTIQAEILVAQLLFVNGRLLEGRYHITAAASLVLSAKLNKYAGGRVTNVGVAGSAGVGAGSTLEQTLPVPKDILEEAERIRAFWTVLWMNNIWTAIDGLPSNITYTTTEARVDTPWPLDFADYKQLQNVGREQITMGHNTIQNFLMNVPDNVRSTAALRSKAGILFEQATLIGAQYKADPSSANLERYFLSLGSLIQRFIENLPAINQASPGASIVDQLCIHTLARVALIRLYLPFVDQDITSFSRVMNAARSVVELLRGVDLSRIQFIDPILAMLWATTCQALMNGTKESRVVDMSWSLITPAGMHSLCREMMSTMEHFVSRCPLMKSQYRDVQAAMRTM